MKNNADYKWWKMTTPFGELQVEGEHRLFDLWWEGRKGNNFKIAFKGSENKFPNVKILPEPEVLTINRVTGNAIPDGEDAPNDAVTILVGAFNKKQRR